MAPPRKLFLARISAAASFWADEQKAARSRAAPLNPSRICRTGENVRLFIFPRAGCPENAARQGGERLYLNGSWNLDDVCPRDTEIDTTKGVGLPEEMIYGRSSFEGEDTLAVDRLYYSEATLIRELVQGQR